MTMLRIALTVAAVFIGAIAAFLGLIVTGSALATGTISLTYEAGPAAAVETVAYATDPAAFITRVGLLGITPLVLGLFAARWGWRQIQRPPASH